MRKFILTPLLCLILLPLLAQTGGDYKIFTESAEGYSNLYRGTAPLAYKFTHTGTYYAYSADFMDGIVKYNNKLYSNLKLNLNSHLDELYLFIKHTGRYVVLNKDYVDYFKMGEREFRHIREMKGSKGDMLSPGYYEVLYKKDDLILYKKIRKTYAERINQAVNAETKSKVERLFIASFSYYLVKGENVKSIKRVGEIIKLYPSVRKEIRQLIREKNLDQRADRDHAFTEIIKFVEFTNPTRK